VANAQHSKYYKMINISATYPV